jgi:hypothetical protein
VAALVVRALQIALYKETTSQRTERAAASLARACDASFERRVCTGACRDGDATASNYLNYFKHLRQPDRKSLCLREHKAWLPRHISDGG